MPFVMMCGLPSSGKTYLVAKLVEYLKNEHKKNVHVIDDAAYLSSSKNSIYQDSAKEKELRATLKSEAQKLMSKEDIVILDHMNYIKGYRYELFCISKLVQTPQCVIYCTRDLDECLELNKKRPENEQYSEEIMQALKMRFEVPDAKNRWDSTLFTISAEESDNLPLEEIANALLSQKAPPPNKSTLNKPLSDTTFLHDIDKISQDILTHILSLQTNQLAANEVSVPGATQKVKLIRPVTLAELRKWRQQFLTYVKMHPPSDAGKIPNMFVDYINNLII